MGFPCNQFGAQEPGSDAEILDFARSNYQVNFPMFSKIEVNGNAGGGFDAIGSTEIEIEEGMQFGFIIGGSNFDSTSQLRGDLRIFDVVWP